MFCRFPGTLPWVAFDVPMVPERSPPRIGPPGPDLGAIQYEFPSGTARPLRAGWPPGSINGRQTDGATDLKEVGERMLLSPHTIKTQAIAIYASSERRVEARRSNAIELGLLEPFPGLGPARRRPAGRAARLDQRESERMPPKAKDFQRIVREVLAPTLADQGFARPRGVGLGGWVRPEQQGWLVIWTQPSRSNYGDSPEGYTFTVELQLGRQPIAGAGATRARLYGLLTDAERAEHLAIRNDIVRKTRPHPHMLGPATGGMGWYLDEFRPRSAPFDRSTDVWFRYTDEDDARRWLGFVARVLPGAIERFIATGRSQEGARRP